MSANAIFVNPTAGLGATKDSPVDRRHLLLGALIIAAVTLFFFSLFFNRFAGIRTINGSGAAGQALLSGRLPVRDWFSPAPPLHAMKNALLVRVFGTALIVPRAFALFERTLLALLLYFWLARRFRISHSALAAIVAILVSAGDITDPIASYNHDTILWAVACGFFASICLDGRAGPRAWAFALLAGVCAALCFGNKQTIGLGITVCVPILVTATLWRSIGAAIARRFLCWFTMGWSAVAGALLAWLASHDLVGGFLSQIFVRGPKAKAGSGSDFVVRWFAVMLFNHALLVGCIIALLILLPVLQSIVRSGDQRSRDQLGASCEKRMSLLWVGLIAALSLAGAEAAAHAGMQPFAPLIKASIYLVLIGTGILASYYTAAFVIRLLSVREAHFWLLGTVSFVCAFMLSLSWPAFEAMVMPGLGFLVAVLLEVQSGWKRTASYALCALLIFSVTLTKLDTPFGFNDWMDPSVMSATVRSSVPEMKGFLLPEVDVRMIDGTTKIIREHARPGDTIFTYPSMPIFYALTGFFSPAYAGDHNIDACPDDIASEDAKRLLRARPAVIIYYAQDSEFLSIEELLWRGGKRSGQRDIIAAVETLASEYHLAATFDAPPTTLQVKIYVRP